MLGRDDKPKTNESPLCTVASIYTYMPLGGNSLALLQKPLFASIPATCAHSSVG